MTGSGNVEKVDANTLTLTGNNSYTGDTTLRNGTTLVAAGATLGVENSNATHRAERGKVCHRRNRLQQHHYSQRRYAGSVECN